MSHLRAGKQAKMKHIGSFSLDPMNRDKDGGGGWVTTKLQDRLQWKHGQHTCTHTPPSAQKIQLPNCDAISKL
ncbi:hypothetical protein XELAEV_18021924mg [Xenopus laevis]|uniref:Uncharacterized protein n=1 Tax=Xenopus laevis TaxID=8355 RepID=A0A974D3C9_XENLA|nr:hypothetical protein XELAEV_18021924mg [Xenopus laevis]